MGEMLISGRGNSRCKGRVFEKPEEYKHGSSILSEERMTVCWELLWLYTPDNYLGVTFPRRLESRHVRQLTFHKYNIGSNVCLPYCILVISLVKEKKINPLLGGCVKQATQNNASGEAAHILSTSSTLSSSSSVSHHTTPERSMSSAPLASLPHHIPSLAYTWQRHPCGTPYLASVDWTGADADHLPGPIRFWHLEICNGDRGWIGQSVLEAGIVRSWRGRARAMGKWKMIKNKMWEILMSDANLQWGGWSRCAEISSREQDGDNGWLTTFQVPWGRATALESWEPSVSWQ